MATRIMLLDDDSDDQELFSEALASIDQSITCECYPDGSAGLHRLTVDKQSHPSIIFLDLNMPIMDGWNFLETIKRDAELKYIPVIVYSTSNRKADFQSARTLGALCFVTKPPTFTLIRALLQIVISSLQHKMEETMCLEIHQKLNLKFK